MWTFFQLMVWASSSLIHSVHKHLLSTRHCFRLLGCSDEGKQRKSLPAWEVESTREGTQCSQLYFKASCNTYTYEYTRTSFRSVHSCACASYRQHTSPTPCTEGFTSSEARYSLRTGNGPFPLCPQPHSSRPLLRNMTKYQP